jgi:long-chain acyl-CoA synthetase
VVYTHRTLAETSRLYRQRFAITRRDSSVLCHCLSHNFVFALLTMPFLDAGAALHLVDYGHAGQTAAALARGATFLCLIPWFGFKLLAHLKQTAAPPPPKLRMCLVGADRVPATFHQLFKDATGVTPAELLGMTETNIYATDPLHNGQPRPGSVGTALPEVSIEIRDNAGRALAAGETGEIWVKTPMAMSEYWRDPAETVKTMVDGWIATGDAGRLDANRFLWFAGRIKQIIICDGDNIYPAEIECEILRHPRVRQAAAVGIPHPTRGETVAAVLTLKNANDQLSRDELAEFLADRLAAVKIPTEIILLDELPATPNGKVDRKQLVSLFRGRGEAEKWGQNIK